MKELKIGTLNLQNNFMNQKGGWLNDAKVFANHIEKEQFDVLGTQELTRNFQTKIEKSLVNYHFYGNYRFGSSKIFQKVKLLHNVNESNQIITKHKVIQEYTLLLPFLPIQDMELFDSIVNKSLMPRIVTIVFLEMKDQTICMMNTHLDYQIPNIQKRQLEMLKQLVLFYQRYPIILTGDFNLETENPSFQSFCEFLKTKSIKRVEWNEPTFLNGTTIDHIFLPTDWEELEKGSNIFPMTDHQEVYVKVKTCLTK